MADGSSGANSADSYIGSLISLTSKSEIRYEGILYTVDTENSNIALQNVRSFGTEGRKKDGLPIYASDKVYDYIIFRGSDIKDLQVKSSPSLQPPPQQPPSDPAIISLQSQYSQPASMPTAFVQPPPGPQDGPPQLPFPGVPPTVFRGGVPQMYQPTTGLGSWGPPPPTGPNGNLAMPTMYWQGYYRPPGGQSVLQQQIPPQPLQSLTQPLLPQPSLLQPPLPHPQTRQQVATRPSPALNPSNPIPPITSQMPLVVGQVGGIGPSITSSPAVTSTLPVVPSVPGSISMQAPSVSSPSLAPMSVAPSAPVPAGVSSPSSVQGVSAVITPAAKNPRRTMGSVRPSTPHSQPPGASTGPTTTVAVSSPSISLIQRTQITPIAAPSVSPLSGKTAASNPGKEDQKMAEPVKLQPAVSVPGETLQHQTQALLPLPTSSTTQKLPHQGNGSLGHTYVRRGRGRGSGSGRGIGLVQPTQQFMEDFDFTAMNEKFNKDEVWGKLGGKGDCKEKVVDVDEEDVVDAVIDDLTDGLQKSSPDALKTPVYVKDDFFDTLSCDALDREEGRAERTKFSEQRKIDTETFGNFPLKSRGARRGGRRGGFRGGYYGAGYMGGRSNGYGRGRGASRHATAIN